jgi:hypothetical protein
MQSYTLDHVGDDVLRRDLVASTARVHAAMAIHLAHIAEFDARRLYAPAGYSCMHAYCVSELKLSPDSASKRIQAARAARRFPAIFPALAEGRVNLSSVCLLAPYLSEENLADLMEGATHQSNSAIRELLARRFGFVEPTQFVQPIPGAPLNFLHAAQHVRTATSPPPDPAPGDALHQDAEKGADLSAASPLTPARFHIQFHPYRGRAREASLRASLTQPCCPQRRARGSVREGARRADSGPRDKEVSGAAE